MVATEYYWVHSFEATYSAGSDKRRATSEAGWMEAAERIPAAVDTLVDNSAGASNSDRALRWGTCLAEPGEALTGEGTVRHRAEEGLRRAEGSHTPAAGSCCALSLTGVDRSWLEHSREDTREVDLWDIGSVVGTRYLEGDIDRGTGFVGSLVVGTGGLERRVVVVQVAVYMPVVADD
jgi:hypothetical protein